MFFGVLNCGLRPLRAVGSLSEPEAVGAIGAYAPEGFWICGITRFYRFINACSNIKHPELCIEQPVSSIEYPVSSIQYPASSNQYRVSSIQYPASRIKHRGSPPNGKSADCRHRQTVALWCGYTPKPRSKYPAIACKLYGFGRLHPSSGSRSTRKPL